jgi:hypothetical protein
MDAAWTASHVLDLGRRIELVSMDTRFHDITVALYREPDRFAAVVHSYSHKPGVRARLDWIAAAMATLGGLRRLESERPTLGFDCDGWHELAIRRAFLEACKPDPAAPVTPRPLVLDDNRSSQHIAVNSLGDGAYQVTSSGATQGEADRASAIAAGLAKLGELAIHPGDPMVVRTPCGAPHDDLVGMLLPRALNVRAALRELEAAATRGVLVAPSAQEAVQQ